METIELEKYDDVPQVLCNAYTNGNGLGTAVTDENAGLAVRALYDSFGIPTSFTNVNDQPLAPISSTMTSGFRKFTWMNYWRAKK
jgi:hypothetical protein